MTGSSVFTDMYEGTQEGVDPGDAGNLICSRWGQFIPLVSGGAETRTLKDPTHAGIMFILGMKTDGGDIVITADTAVNDNGDNTITFANAGELMVFVSGISGTSYVWRTLAPSPEADGPALSTV